MSFLLSFPYLPYFIPPPLHPSHFVISFTSLSSFLSAVFVLLCVRNILSAIFPKIIFIELQFCNTWLVKIEYCNQWSLNMFLYHFFDDNLRTLQQYSKFDLLFSFCCYPHSVHSSIPIIAVIYEQLYILLCHRLLPEQSIRLFFDNSNKPS